MADPHPEARRGDSEAKGAASEPDGDAPSRSAPSGPPSREAGSAAGSAGRKGSPSLALRLRHAHAALAPWVLAPLLLTVSTGLGYRLLRDWGGLGRDQAHGLMVLHEGEWLRHWFGPSGETLYVLANGLGLLWMLGSGAALLWQRWRRPGNRAGGDT